MATESNPISEAAHAYVERGYRIIALHTAHNGRCSCSKGDACGSAGKHPINLGWQKAPQMEVGGIRARFGSANPNNIGIVTGPDSGVFVVDLDGEAGSASMATLVAEHGDLPSTLTGKTGSGGWHFYFEYPDFEIGNSASTKLGKGIDTRGKGGFVVAPPSVSAKGPYKIVRDLPVAKAPDWLLEKLRPKERKAPTTPEVTAVPRSEISDPEKRRLLGYLDGAVANELDRLDRLHWDGDPSAYRGEPWDNTVFEVACNLLQLALADWNDLDERAAYDLFVKHAPVDPGFDAARVDAKWESAIKKIDGDPAVYPPKPVDMGAWMLADADISPAPMPSEDQPAADAFDALVASTADQAPPPGPPSIDVVEFNGIPTRDDHTLDPDFVVRAKAAALGPHYSSRAYVEENRSDAGFWDIEEFIAQPKAGPGPTDLTPVETWMRRSLRSGTPELLWAALGTIILGVDTDAPTIVLKGGGPLLALLARTLTPAVGPETEMMLLGPRVSTKEVDGPQVVFEFDDDEIIDLMPYAYAIIMRARDSVAELGVADASTHDDLEKLDDYRAAQLHRARLGLGSRARVNGDTDVP